jgi:hypothetical protein
MKGKKRKGNIIKEKKGKEKKRKNSKSASESVSPNLQAVEMHIHLVNNLYADSNSFPASSCVLFYILT